MFSDKACPQRACPRCERLVAFRHEAVAREPGWFNGPVPPFGEPTARVLIVGLAPGLQGANRTGRPFTGDYAGELLYQTLGEYGFATGVYAARPDDGLRLVDAAIVNAVRCVPPQNKPLPAEMAQCRPFLAAAIAEMPDLGVIVALGRIAHESALRTLGARLASCPFGHGAEFELSGPRGPVTLLDSYHCSRYNTNTRVLTPDMFRAVFARARALIDAPR